MVTEKRSDEGRLIRPYTITGGRTGADSAPIALEALVKATTLGAQIKHQFRWEAARVIDLARADTALVELAARLDVPIGVARVVVADLAQRGAVTIIEPRGDTDGDEPGNEYASLLQKVLDGIKSL
jgi:hypothetical protein